jgi:hypothetical protein
MAIDDLAAAPRLKMKMYGRKTANGFDLPA